MEKYLTPQPQPQPPPVPTIQEQKKFRRDSASGIDQFFNEDEGSPYSINMNVFLPDITHLRTGLFKPQRPAMTQIKTEPVCSYSQQNGPTNMAQTLPEFTSVFNTSQGTHVNGIYIKQEMPSPEIPQQGHLFHSVAHLPSAMSDLNDLHLASQQTPVKQFHCMPNGTFTVPTHFLHHQQQHKIKQHHGTYFPPSPPSSEPGSPDRQTLLQNFSPPPSYAASIASKLGVQNPNISPAMQIAQQSMPVRFNRRTNPDLEKRRIHHCDFQGKLRNLV
ncbi:Krueppel-like factor 5 [Acipenser ruthenus]|uniref:Krueppel-like factor 5 n=1 Tax=Acipenser ruthenus TaxID=7906 RepID=A0A662YPU4_ACIRT|nr:Krueppel-like factor 5 [Acipenser ruthenus]